MELELTQEDGFLLALTTGPIDDSASRPFRDTLHPLFAETDVRLIVDISGSKWINSEGLAVLVRLVTDANSRGGRVVVAAPTPFVGEVLQVTRLGSFFDVAATRQEAMELILTGDRAEM